MSSILAPVSATAYKNGHMDWYGVIEIAVATGEVVWRFDAATSDFETSRLYQDGNVVRRSGFRPASVQRLDDGMTLISDWSRGVLVDEDGDVRETFTHELMNDVHEIQRTPGGTYLVASTGMDTVLVLDEDFEELWRWHMWEHVDRDTRPSEYYPDQLWYRNPKDLALNPDDRYHLNYVTPLEGTGGVGDLELLCSALNYGIFAVSMETDAVLREYTDLDECHNPYPMEETYAVAESGEDQVTVVDWDGRRETLFDEGLNFVKDADPVGENGDWLLADTKHHRVLIWNEDEAEPKREFYLGGDANPYEADYLKGSDSFA